MIPDWLIVAYLSWGALCWVLRGGLFGKLYRRALGIPDDQRPQVTTLTRIATMGALVAPLVVLDVVSWQIGAALWATCYLASTLGYFGEAMGIERGARDVALMSLWGVVVFAVALTGVTVPDTIAAYLAVGFDDWPWSWIDVRVQGVQRVAPWILCGAVAGPAYAINKRFGRRFGTDWTERAEATVGAALAVALWGVTSP